MSCKTWVDSRVKKCGWIDVKLIQLSSVTLALMVAKFWKPLLSLDWYWYAIIALLAAIKPFYTIFKK